MKKNERSAFQDDPFRWLVGQTRRCFVDHFQLPGKVDYAVCVYGRRRLVWDIEESLTVDLNVDSLLLCTGIKSKNLRVRALEMVAQSEKKTQNMRKTVGVIELD